MLLRTFVQQSFDGLRLNGIMKADPNISSQNAQGPQVVRAEGPKPDLTLIMARVRSSIAVNSPSGVMNPDGPPVAHHNTFLPDSMARSRDNANNDFEIRPDRSNVSLPQRTTKSGLR
jgi:hypothetical protein